MGLGFTHRHLADRFKTSLLCSGLAGDFDYNELIDDNCIVNISKLKTRIRNKTKRS